MRPISFRIWPLLSILIVLLLGQVWVLLAAKQGIVQQTVAETSQVRTVSEGHLTLAPKRQAVRNHSGSAQLPALFPLLLTLLPVLIVTPVLGRWPLGYLNFANHRLGGWQEANLQFRFTQSRQ